MTEALRDRLIALRDQLFAELAKGETLEISFVCALAAIIVVLDEIDSMASSGRAGNP
jgi:hypothetical protein